MIHQIRFTLKGGRKVWVVLMDGAWRQIRNSLQSLGLWADRGDLLKAALIAGHFRKWNPRGLFKNGGWASDRIELHPACDQASVKKLIKAAVSALRSQKLTPNQADQSAQDQWERQLRVVDGGRVILGVPKKFPAYDAPIYFIPKKKHGEFRRIASACPEQIAAGRCLLPALIEMIDSSLPIHGFMPCRSPVTNARPHIGFHWSLCMDLEDFFDHVTLEKLVETGMAHSLAQLITDADGVARQGYATSPAAANIAFQSVDKQILKAIRKICPDAVYTRYADDLTVSSNNFKALRKLQAKIGDIIVDSGFKVSPHKTHLRCAKAGSRIITGVAVGDKSMRVPREIRRRLRACNHQGNIPVANGLSEWALMKEPKGYREG
jgi:hypothetical protein